MIRILFYLIYFLIPLSMVAQKPIDVFIWAGQSNAQGWTGDAKEYPQEGKELDTEILLNYTFYGKESSEGEWITMQAQRGRYPLGHFGPEVSFARELKKVGYNPAIFKYCLGATGLSRDWKAPGQGGIYDAMVVHLRTSIQKLTDSGYDVSVRGFIWIQGESDAADDRTASEYQENLKRLLDDLRNVVVKNENLAIVLGVDEQHDFVRQRPAVVEAQKKIAKEDRHIVYTSMLGLPKADATHLTPTGLVAHGERIFEGYQLLRPELPILEGKKDFAAHWEYVGIAVEQPGYTIWGTSPIQGDDGKIHLFVARWPGNTVERGRRSHSEIAHYLSDSPEGPFVFSDVALKGTGRDTWDRYGMHNPNIQKVNDTYVLVYIANNDHTAPVHPSNQKIGMATSDSPYGPWKKVNGDGLILDVPKNPEYWNHKASNGVNNPALLQHPDGSFYLYFKSEKGTMGLAVAENLEGPYVQMPFPVTKNEQAIEDGYAFMMNGTFCLLTTDNHGLIEKGGGILWKSEDGITFDQMEQGFYPTKKYLGQNRLKNAVNHYAGDVIKFERPQLLFDKGLPRYLYVASGYHWFGGPAPVSYVFKYQ